MQFVFSGKAHPADKAGQDLIKKIIEVSKMPEFIGKIIFIENYNMHVAKQMVRGVDVWLNTPTRPLEASGTSGEKAAMNGVVNFSVLDGWWAEGYKKGAGWALAQEQVYESDSYQNAYDAELIYETLENKIVPDYYNQDDEGVSREWVIHIKNTIADIAPHFTMKRQLDEYYTKFYNKLITRSKLMMENNAKNARDYSAWKHRMRRQWNSIELVDIQLPDYENQKLTIDNYFSVSLTLHLNDINPEYIGVEVVVVRKVGDIIKDYYRIIPMEMTNYSHNKASYSVSVLPLSPGVYSYSIRVYAKHPLMPNRMDFPLLKWI